MMKKLFCLITICCLMLGLASCVKADKPDASAPDIYVNEATDITRHTATLSGGVHPQEGVSVSVCRFLIGTTENDLQEIPTDFAQNEATAAVSELHTGTDYVFCLEVGNGKQLVRSKVMGFSTLPEGAVVLGKMEIDGQTPVSLYVSCPVTDTGGNGLQETGFAYKTESDATETEVAATLSGDELQAKITPLQTNTTYTVRAFAANSKGRTYSDAVSVTTSDAITVPQAGQLSTVIGEKGKYDYTSINISGQLNGTDLRFLRSMAGCGTLGESATPGKLEKINLTEADIVEGGLSYDGSRFTENGVISSGMFANLPYLKELNLPASATKVEESAFASSALLEYIALPQQLTTVTASSGCTSLKKLWIIPENENYTTTDGVLYNKQQTEIVWCPTGKDTEQLTLPATLTVIRKYTFNGCRIAEVVIPESVTSIESFAFAESGITSIVLPDRMTRLDKGVFARCSNLKKVTLGSHMGYLCEACFSGIALTELYVRASIPPVWQDATTFGGLDASDCTVYVPSDQLEKYKYHTTWGKFKLRAIPE